MKPCYMGEGGAGSEYRSAFRIQDNTITSNYKLSISIIGANQCAYHDATQTTLLYVIRKGIAVTCN